MEVVELYPRGKKKKKREGIIVRVSNKEALKIIQSIANQMYNESSNTGREEFYCNIGYFSIVLKKEEKQ